MDRLNNIKRLRHDDEVRLADLVKTREHVACLTNAKIKLSELYDRVTKNVEQSTPEIKALTLDALNIKVYANGIGKVEIKGIIPLELAIPTTART